MSVIWFICWSVGWFDLSVCHNFLKVTLPCAFLCTYVLTLSVKTSAVLCYEYQCWKQSTLTFLVRKLPGAKKSKKVFFWGFLSFSFFTPLQKYTETFLSLLNPFHCQLNICTSVNMLVSKNTIKGRRKFHF